MADATWKAVERKVAALFGGIRTPLSGSNSKHDTQGDVIRGDHTRAKNPDPLHLCMFPKWLYVETKRHKGLQLLFREWKEKRDALMEPKGPGFVLYVYEDAKYVGQEPEYIFFDLEEWIGAESPTNTNEPNHYSYHLLRSNSAILSLFADTEKKAEEEKRKVAVVAQRIHSRKGTFVFMKNADTAQVLEFAREVQAKKGEGVK